jgi:hypothetical protein
MEGAYSAQVYEHPMEAGRIYSSPLAEGESEDGGVIKMTCLSGFIFNCFINSKILLTNSSYIP